MFGFIDNIRGNIQGKVNDAQRMQRLEKYKYDSKIQILNFLHNNDLMEIAKKYISFDPKVLEYDEKGREKFRKPNRQELTESIMYKVPTEVILADYPKLKNKLKDVKDNYFLEKE